MSARRISLSQQIDEIDYELGQRSRVYPGLATSKKRRQSELDYHVARLEAVRATLVWLAAHEVEIKAFLALSTDARIAVIGYGAQMGEICLELDRREAAAKAGEPVR